MTMTSKSLLDDYLTETEAATELHVCLRTLIRWRDLKQGPTHTKIGRRVYYKIETVAAWIASREAA